MSRRLKVPYTSDEVKQAFKIFTDDATTVERKPGFIHRDDVVNALTTYGTEKMSKERALELIQLLEPDDATGMIHYSQYIDTMLNW